VQCGASPMPLAASKGPAWPLHQAASTALPFKKHGEQVQRATRSMKTDLLGKGEGTRFTSAENQWRKYRAGVGGNSNNSLLMDRGWLYCQWSLLVFGGHWQ